MGRFLLSFALTFLSVVVVKAQSHTISLGIYTGITTSYTFDQGINLDPRLQARYDVKFAPVGINLGVDFDGYGVMISPGVLQEGQNHYVVNTSGGQEGQQRIDLRYLNFPVAFKLHMIDLSFFKVSFTGGLGFAYLLSGKQTISHNATKLRFPAAVYPILPEDYTVVYDGVFVPVVNNYVISGKNDFKPFQLFGQLGLRSDWDVSDDWRVSFDFHVNYGILDPRSDSYLQRLDARQTLYDIPGKRRDFFGQLTIGISRYVIIDKKETARKKISKGSPKKYTTKKYPWPAPRNRKPKP